MRSGDFIHFFRDAAGQPETSDSSSGSDDESDADDDIKD
jgi:hypothetical protein